MQFSELLGIKLSLVLAQQKTSGPTSEPSADHLADLSVLPTEGTD